MERQIFLPLCCSYTCCYFSCHSYTRCDIFVFLGKRLAPVKSTRLPTNRTDNAPPTSTNNTLVREWPTLGLHNWHQSNWKMKNQLDRKLMFLLQCPEKTLTAVFAKVVNFIIVDINVWRPSQTLDFWVVWAESIAACDNDSHVLRPCSVYAWRIGCTTTPLPTHASHVAPPPPLYSPHFSTPPPLTPIPSFCPLLSPSLPPVIRFSPPPSNPLALFTTRRPKQWMIAHALVFLFSC